MSMECTCNLPPWVKNAMYHANNCPKSTYGQSAIESLADRMSDDARDGYTIAQLETLYEAFGDQFVAGRIAYLRGEATTDCPFYDGSPRDEWSTRTAEWMDGWDAQWRAGR